MKDSRLGRILISTIFEFSEKNLLEAGDGLPCLIGKEQKEILVEGLLIQKFEES